MPYASRPVTAFNATIYEHGAANANSRNLQRQFPGRRQYERW